MILTEIGEIGVIVDERQVILRPSLYAMSQLGSPTAIVETYASVMQETYSEDQLADALSVIHACSEKDLSEIFGYFTLGDNTLVYNEGRIPKEDILPLARCLVKHGVTGDIKEVPTKKGEPPTYTQEFNCREHVSVAIAHLGMSREEAWASTMTELVGALQAKFPVGEGKAGLNSPTKEEHEATMEWYTAVQKARGEAH